MAGLFYVDDLVPTGATLTIGGDEGHHAATVRRIRAGERLTLSDGAGELADCAVVTADRSGLTVEVLRRWTQPAPRPPVTVVQALPKSERSELAIELATEAGADGFVAWQAERCVARWEGPRADKGLRRWSAVARAAAGQSRRAWIPTVDGVLTTTALATWVAEQTAAGTVVLVLHDAAPEPLTALGLADAAAVALLVGPEGGITPAELDAFTTAGARPLRLGPTVLRTSTAAAVALGALGVLTPRWG
ncbi:16S rRNA (uracil(1498)-N(3))-methyltransferase [Mycobacterium sp. M1]|uniref:Ribosomal RNA small subunit methyltransferase E n=1 Tax=Mycolicibacter acidiphilus TaxID=2835306 RepID=A0ABS5RJU0_9MYCO|nr:16S rRNA (uracil(1498)-N(3))-methyltransferase [Mycolicibacter acidiphilus]MBS9534558.1 16S rRNA (uracil(1498)-N(3))-methyltransferase [Mycolicibacter acidiphilus]